MCKSWSHVDYLCCIGALLHNRYQHLVFILVGGGGSYVIIKSQRKCLD